MSDDLSRTGAGDSSKPSVCTPLADAFVGREREMAELRAGLDDAIAGRGRLFLLSGEPGIGKSRLAEELSRQATERAVCVVWGRCWEGGGVPAYWPISQVLQVCAERSDFLQVVETLGPKGSHLAMLAPQVAGGLCPKEKNLSSKRANSDPEQNRFRLFESVASLLKSLASREPMLIVIDDLHDADSSTLEMLRFLARELKSVPLLLIGTHREVEVERSPELQSAIAALAREGSQLPLSGLTQSDTANFVSARAGVEPHDQFLALLHQTTNGNPLFLEGVARMLAGTGKLGGQERLTVADLKLPADVRGAIKARIAGLSAQSEAVLSAAAVVGNEFELELLQRVLDGPGGDVVQRLDEAVMAAVIERVADSPGRYRYSHALIRGVIYDAIGTMEQHRLHRRIAEEIEKLYAGHIEAHLQELAHHYIEASPSGTTEKAIEYSIRAGNAANAACAYAEAHENWKAALTLIDLKGEGDSAQRAYVLTHLADEAGAKAIDYLEAALREFEKLGDERSMFATHLQLGAHHSMANITMNLPQAFEHLRKAEVLAAKDSSGVALAWVLAARAGACTWSNRIDEGVVTAQRAIENSKRAGGDEFLQNFSAMDLGLFLAAQGHVRQGLEMLEQSRTRSDLMEAAGFGVMVACRGAEVCFMLDDPRKAKEWPERELSHPWTARSPWRCSIVHYYLSKACAETGDLKEASRHDKESRILVSPVGAWPGDFRRLFYEGDWDSARKLGEQCLEGWIAKGGLRPAIEFGFLLARLHRTRGDYDRAREVGEDALSMATAHGDVGFELRGAAELALISGSAGRTGEASRHLARCHEILAAGEDWRGLVGHVARAEAVVASIDLRMSDAGLAFEQAIGIFQRYSLPWEEADSLYYWARALGDADEKTSAVPKLDSAVDIYRRIGAGQPWIGRMLALKEKLSEAIQPVAGSDGSNLCALRREGEFWTIAYEGTTSRLKDAKGLHYIAYLLGHPHEEIRAPDLAALIEGAPADEADMTNAHDLARSSTHTGDLGDAGEILDDQAKAAYGRRLKELREELEEARESENAERAEEAQAEIEALAHELKSAIGLGGRRRRAASSSERARTATTRAIRLALAKIAENNPALGRLLSTTVKTGASCSYVPDDRFLISWKL